MSGALFVLAEPSCCDGRLRMVVGDYGERKSLPQRKDGSFNYEAAAQHLSIKVAELKSKRDTEARIMKNASYEEAIREEFNLPAHSDIIKTSRGHHVGEIGRASRRWVSYAAPVGMVYLSLVNTVTPEQARAILAAAVAAGVKFA